MDEAAPRRRRRRRAAEDDGGDEVELAAGPASAPLSPRRPPSSMNPYAAPSEADVAGAVEDEFDVAPAGFGIRAAARIIDLVVHTGLASVAGIAAGIVVGVLAAGGTMRGGWQARLGAETAGLYVMGIVASLVSSTVGEGVGGATVGKVICGLRVLSQDRTPCTFGKALGRNLAYYVDALFCALIGYMAMSNSPLKQRNGDQWARTIVVYARSVPLSAERATMVAVAMGIVAAGLVELLWLVWRAF